MYALDLTSHELLYKQNIFLYIIYIFHLIIVLKTLTQCDNLCHQMQILLQTIGAWKKSHSYSFFSMAANISPRASLRACR